MEGEGEGEEEEEEGDSAAAERQSDLRYILCTILLLQLYDVVSEYYLQLYVSDDDFASFGSYLSVIFLYTHTHTHTHTQFSSTRNTGLTVWPAPTEGWPETQVKSERSEKIKRFGMFQIPLSHLPNPHDLTPHTLSPPSLTLHQQPGRQQCRLRNITPGVL